VRRANADNIVSCPVVVTNQGKLVAVLVAIDDADLETIALAPNRCFLA
jgi:hypothetical protein